MHSPLYILVNLAILKRNKAATLCTSYKPLSIQYLEQRSRMSKSLPRIHAHIYTNAPFLSKKQYPQKGATKYFHPSDISRSVAADLDVTLRRSYIIILVSFKPN